MFNTDVRSSVTVSVVLYVAVAPHLLKPRGWMASALLGTPQAGLARDVIAVEEIAHHPAYYCICSYSQRGQESRTSLSFIIRTVGVDSRARVLFARL